MKKYKRINFEERVKIESFLIAGWCLTAIGVELGRPTSAVSRELSRFPFKYTAEKANKEALRKAKIHNCHDKLVENQRLYNLVMRLLRKHWSPQQISTHLKRKYTTLPSMQISHESIYTYIYLLAKGELKKELIGYLRQKKKSRYSRKGANDKRGKISEMLSIEERPKEVESRSVAGHWEGDLIMGRNHKSAIGSIVERKTRTVLLVKLKGKDATSVRKAFEREFKSLPSQMKLSMTYDQGREMAEHKLFTKNTRMKVFFCHPASPWERGTNENTNMLIRDYFPKGTDFSTITKKELKRVQHELNERPRRALNDESPKEVFQKEILAKCS